MRPLNAGGLGVLHAKWIVENTPCRRLALLSRGRALPKSIVDLAERHGDNLRIRVYSADVTDERATRAAFASAAAELGPVSAVFHLSGVLADEPPIGGWGGVHGGGGGRSVSQLPSSSAWRVVAAPKIAGSVNVLKALCEVSGGGGGGAVRRGAVSTENEAAETALVMSSSIYACLGHPRLAGYAAGNAFQDGLCAAIQQMNGRVRLGNTVDVKDDAVAVPESESSLPHFSSSARKENGFPSHALAIQWGTWASEGMAARLGAPFEVGTIDTLF